MNHQLSSLGVTPANDTGQATYSGSGSY